VKRLRASRVEVQSITESLDYSNLQGRLLLKLLESFAAFSSDMLVEHVKKGLNLGTVPFGYRSYLTKESRERRRPCDPEHPQGCPCGGCEQICCEGDIEPVLL
jgi:DNA invertase Pin-like site-specific DNA recombinase